jgi:hypothetical protein
MSTPLTRAQAKTWTIGAQGVALVCVLAAVAVGIKGLPEHQSGASVEIARNNAMPFQPRTPGNSSGSGNPDINNGYSVDTAGTAQRFALLDNAPKPVGVVAEPTEVPDDPPPGPDVDDVNIIRRVKYIGFINDARTQHAFIRIDGKQRIVKRGGVAGAGEDGMPDLEVMRITPDYIRLRDPENDAEAEVSLASKSSSASVTMVNGGEVIAAEVPTDEESTTALSPEEEAYIESLPARQRQNVRRRMEREKRGLPAENPNRRPQPEALVQIRGGASNSSNSSTDVRRRDDRNDNE